MLSAVSAPTGRPLAVAVDLDSTGVERSEVLSGRWPVAAARAAEQAGVDFVTFPDALALPHQLDALLLATRVAPATARIGLERQRQRVGDRKSTRLNSSHSQISYAVFCL